MASLRKLSGTLAVVAALGLAVPAGADDRRGPDRGHHDRDRKHDKDDDGVGGFLLGAILAGGLVAALSRKKEPKPLPADVAFVPVASVAPVEADEEAAVSACVASAETQARREHPVAQVASVDQVRVAGAGFAVDGQLLVRGSYRDVGERRGFRCSVDGEAVRELSIDGVAVAQL